jgi:murein DD-endopeptidase MepM/ murein hydrolase activator NlpD
VDAPPPDLLDTFGLRPAGPALAAFRRALLGSSGEPKTQFGLSSVRIFKPWIGLPTWLGVRPRDRLTPIYNLFNRAPQPRDEAYSVRVTHARDFLGGQHTYDGHLGTDFAVPVGTPVAAAAPGLVLRVASELDRGGLKVCIDHGDGLFTTSSHLSRARVAEGEVVARGTVVGLSGASGVEFATMFPWVSPHLHFNTWLDSNPVDPFARQGERSLWRAHNDPRPHDGSPTEPFEPTRWDAALVDAAVAACRHAGLRREMEAIGDVSRRAAELIVQRNYRAVLFSAFPPVYPRSHERAPRLDLPFSARDYDGASLRGRRVGDQARTASSRISAARSHAARSTSR